MEFEEKEEFLSKEGGERAREDMNVFSAFFLLVGLRMENIDGGQGIGMC